MCLDEMKGKRLLLLGGNSWKSAAREAADEYGFKIIAVSNDPRAGIFDIADEHFVISSTDSEAMKSLIKREHIDGVHMGANETVIAAASKYINELGLPCFCKYEQWNAIQNKANFKKLCIENGLPVAPAYEYNKITGENFPVITKPADGSGSRGFSVCRDLSELKAGYEKAKRESPSGKVLIEKFMPNESVVVFYTFSNGEAFFTGMEDKYPVHYEEQGSYVMGLFVLESSLKDIFRERFEGKLKNLFHKLGLKEGSLWIEIFYDKSSKEFYFNEAAYRYGGAISQYPVDYFYGINQVAADIYFALTGKSRLKGFISLTDKKLAKKKAKYAIYPVHVKAGKIHHSEGLENIREKDNLIDIFRTIHDGTKVESTGTVRQVYALVHFCYDTDKELRDMIRTIQSSVSIIDDDGNNLINNLIDPDIELRQ